MCWTVSHFYFIFLSVLRNLWHLNFPTRDQTWLSAVRALSISHWAVREFPMSRLNTFYINIQLFWNNLPVKTTPSHCSRVPCLS